MASHRTLPHAGACDQLRRGDDRLPRNLGGHDRIEPVGAQRRPCAPGPGAAHPAATGRALDGSVQLPGRDRVLRRDRLVRRAHRPGLDPDRRAQLERSAIPDVDLLPGAADGWRADGRALCHPPCPLHLPLRPGDDGARARHSARNGGGPAATQAGLMTRRDDPPLPGFVFRLARGGHADLPRARHLRRGAVLRLGPAAHRPGPGGDQRPEFDHADGAAAVRHGERVHAFRRRGQGAGRFRNRLARRHPRLARSGHRGLMHAVRRHLRLERGDRAGHGFAPDPGHDRARLSALVRARRGRRIRHHRHCHPAQSRVAALWHRRRAIGAAAVPRWRAAGLLQAAVFFLWVLYDARRRNFPVEPALPMAVRLRVSLQALPALAVPIVVLVGIYGGTVTVTEAAALSSVTALLVSLIFYRGFHWTKTLDVIADGIRSAGTIMLIVATALAFGHWMTESGVPAQLVDFIVGHHFSTWQFLLMINVLLLVLGCFLEVIATLLLVLPILAPVLKSMGVDPVHFSIIFTHNMEIGLVHPPVGLNLYVLSTISAAPIGEVIRGILPFLILLLLVLGIITYVPQLTLWLPNAVFGP